MTGHVTLEKHFRIDVYSHFFKITQIHPKAYGLLYRFAGRFVHMGYVERQNFKERVPVKTYACKTNDDTEFRFHIGQLALFLKTLEDGFIYPDFYDIEYHPIYKPSKVAWRVKPDWQPREFQPEAIEFVNQKDASDLNSRLVTSPTGSGKGLISLFSAQVDQSRTLVAVLPKYMEKWAEEITEKTDVKAKEIMMVAGSDQVKGLIELAKTGQLKAKFVIISLTTLQNYFKAYEENRFSEDFLTYGCNPEELCELLGIGTLINDETHEHLYSVFKLMCYTNVPKVIALSGTLISEDYFIDRMQKLMFPKEIRFDKIKMAKYIKLYPVSYLFNKWPDPKIRTTAFGSKNYSHIEFEKSITRRPELLNNYMRLIDYFVVYSFLSPYKKGEKLAVYAGSIDMCTRITDYLKKKYPNLDVRRYVEDDPYENLIEPDIRVTTIQSGGTAFDIPNLTTILLTNSIYSPVSNYQTLGRLRNLKDKEMKFFYLYCPQIAKQKSYHEYRKELFADRVASTKELVSPVNM